LTRDEENQHWSWNQFEFGILRVLEKVKSHIGNR